MLNTFSTDELTQESINYMVNTDIDYRKGLGQYFTPKTVREEILSKLPQMNKPKILDPSCGTGEFLISCADMFKNPSLHGIEIDSSLCEIAKSKCNARIVCGNALTIDPEPIYDIVVGNPPYFEFKPNEHIKAQFSEILSGRANAFSMFVKLGLDYLKDGGYLAYVIPPSMNNGAYFNKLRKYIINTATIEHISILKQNKIFHKAQQSVMLLILKKGENNSKNYTFERNGVLIFSEKYDLLRENYKGTFSLKDLGYKVKTGTVVWNQHKDKLTNSENGSLPLLWSHNIEDNKLKIPVEHPTKLQYINYHNCETGPAIIVNRVTGSSSQARLKSAIIPDKMKYLGENHINIIYKDSSKRTLPQMMISLEDLHKTITSKETIEIMKHLIGNTQVSKTELELLLPIRIP